MKTMLFILMFLLCSANPFTGNLHLKLLKGAPGNNQLSYLIYSSEKTYTYSDADSISGKYFVTRQIAAQKFKIIDTIIAPNIDEQSIIEAYLHPGKKILYSRIENESEPAFINWGFMKRVTIRTTESFCRYENKDNLKTVTTSSGIQSETKTNFYFWSIGILFVICFLGSWLYSTVIKIKNKEEIWEIIQIAGPITAILYLGAVVIIVSCIKSALEHGQEFLIISIAVFILPILVRLFKTRHK